MGKQWKQWQTLFWGAPKSLQMVLAANIRSDSMCMNAPSAKPGSDGNVSFLVSWMRDLSDFRAKVGEKEITGCDGKRMPMTSCQKSSKTFF